MLEFDRSWNLNDKLLAVPMRSFSHLADKNDLVLNVDKSKLDTARAFDKSGWPDLNDPRYVVDVGRYLVTVVTTEPTSVAPAGKDATQAKNYRGLKASELIGKKMS